MAAHILCHTNEILPNSFPPPRPSPKDHGMVSEYEPAIIMNSSFSQNHLDISVELDSEINPLLHKPTPTSSQQYNLSDFCDPELSVTPEKSSRSAMKLSKDSNGAASFKPRNSQKVRFDNFVKVKCMSPDSSPSQDLPFPKDLPDRIQPAAVELASTEPECRSDISGNSELDALDSLEEPIVVLASDIKDSNDQRNTADMKQMEATDRQAYILHEKPEHVLARPEFSSTLQVQKVVKDVEDAELDVAVAVKQKLKKSRKLKTAIMEKVTSKVNASSPLFEGLVSTEPCKDDLVLATEKQKMFKVKPAVRNAKPEDSSSVITVGSTSALIGNLGEIDNMDNIVHAPDLLEYLTPDLLHETASLTITGTVVDDDGPKTADLLRAFDVYRHIRTWEGW